ASIRRADGSPRIEAQWRRDPHCVAIPGGLVRGSMMKDLARRYLQREISRRDFVRLAGVAGFSMKAATSAARALEPMMSEAGELTTTFQGTGGELVAEQLRAAGIHFIFVCNSSGMGPLCDAVVDRSDLQFIQGTSEHQTVAMADGFAKATLRPSFVCFSRVGGPLAS